MIENQFILRKDRKILVKLLTQVKNKDNPVSRKPWKVSPILKYKMLLNKIWKNKVLALQISENLQLSDTQKPKFLKILSNKVWNLKKHYNFLSSATKIQAEIAIKVSASKEHKLLNKVYPEVEADCDNMQVWWILENSLNKKCKFLTKK